MQENICTRLWEKTNNESITSRAVQARREKVRKKSQHKYLQTYIRLRKIKKASKNLISYNRFLYSILLSFFETFKWAVNSAIKKRPINRYVWHITVILSGFGVGTSFLTCIPNLKLVVTLFRWKIVEKPVYQIRFNICKKCKAVWHSK